MSSETMNVDATAILYHLRKTVDEIKATQANQGGMLQDAALARERAANNIHNLEARVGDLASADKAKNEEIRKLRHELRGLSQKFESVQALHEIERETTNPLDIRHGSGKDELMVRTDEVKTRTRLWAALTLFVTAAIGWLGGMFSKGP